MRISDWSSDVALPICSWLISASRRVASLSAARTSIPIAPWAGAGSITSTGTGDPTSSCPSRCSPAAASNVASARSEEHTSELQSLMRISYAVFCLKKKNNINNNSATHIHLICILLLEQQTELYSTVTHTKSTNSNQQKR